MGLLIACRTRWYPHVEYSLTPLGEEVSEKVAALADWIELNLPQVMSNRDERAA